MTRLDSVGATSKTLTVPSTAKLFTQYKFAPGLAGERVMAPPLANGWLKIVNLSPGANGWARLRLVIVNVPAPVLFNVPPTTTELLLMASDLSTLMHKLPAIERLL